MKDQYAADVGDYGKCGLLRHLFPGGTWRLGVVWYLTPPETREARKRVGDYTQYLDRRGYRDCDADLFDILCLLHQISQLEILVPRDLHARVATFATDVPWDEALSNLVSAAGLQYAIDKNRVFIGTKGGDPAAIDTCVPATRGAGDRQWSQAVTRLENIAARDLVFAGVAGANDKRKAYAYGPMRKLWPLEPGTRLYDARVETVGANGVTLKTDDGQIIDLRI
jgi:hypothetical protein